MRVKWLRKALRNLELEAEYIARDNPVAAKQVVGRIHAAVGLLRQNPALGKPGRIHGTRELLVPDTRYLIPYRVKADTVEILRVFHTSRKPPESW